MATLAKTYTFTSGTTIVSAQVNTNFDDIVNFVNSNAIQKDGSLAMTADLSLPNSEPGSANAAVRRKSAYRGCLGSSIAAANHTVGGGSATSFTYMNSPVTNAFGYTPDYDYNLIILFTGTMILSNGGATLFLRAESPDGTVINRFGPGTGQEAEWTGPAANVYMPIAFTAIKAVSAGTVPTWSLMYKVVGTTTVSIWCTAMAWIQPSTRPLPN